MPWSCSKHNMAGSGDYCIYCEDAGAVGNLPLVPAGKMGDILPTDPQARKNSPIARGFLDYFPRAIAVVAELSRVANEQHNPGEPMHWSKGKSDDHADCLVRHLLERGTTDVDNQLHSAKVAWRAMALLEIELESATRERLS